MMFNLSNNTNKQQKKKQQPKNKPVLMKAAYGVLDATLPSSFIPVFKLLISGPVGGILSSFSTSGLRILILVDAKAAPLFVKEKGLFVTISSSSNGEGTPFGFGLLLEIIGGAAEAGELLVNRFALTAGVLRLNEAEIGGV